MITGAARAQAALLVIDAHEGIQENSRRHGYMMSMLGISQIAVLVNKMDLVGYDRALFDRIEQEYRQFLSQVNVAPVAFIPVVGRDGEHIAARSSNLSWYTGPTVLEALDAFAAARPDSDQPFRMPVQDVYKFTNRGDDRRIVAGTVASGTVRPGDTVVFYPSGKRARVKAVEAFNRDSPASASAGEATGFTLQEQIYVGRGELAALAHESRPQISSRLRVSLFWLGRSPLVARKDYIFKIGAARATMRVEEIHRVIDASNLGSTEHRDRIERHEVAECTIACNRAIAFDLADAIADTSRFVIVDAYEISGGGIVRESLPDKQVALREKVLLRENKWEPSFIAPERRSARFAQRPTLLVITGPRDADRKGLARSLEARLFDDGRVVYFLGIGNVVYGVDADLAGSRENRREHIRRLAEVANLMLDAGVILIASAQEITQEELELIKTTVDSSRLETVWVGDATATDLACDLTLVERDGEEQNVERIRSLLVEKGVLFQPW
jgi:bifunctional enzyme CysN/CysC